MGFTDANAATDGRDLTRRYLTTWPTTRRPRAGSRAGWR